MYTPVLVTPPAIKPITSTEAKAWLDVTYTDKDSLITGLIAAATSHLDGWKGILGRCLCEQTWRQDFDEFCGKLRLRLGPVISITSVKYDDADGAEQTVSANDYTLRSDDDGFYIQFDDGFSNPTTSGLPACLRAAYLAGYPTSTGAWTGPEDIKQAIFLLVRHWFDNPSAVVVGVTAQTVPMTVEALLSKYRKTFV